MDGRNDIEYSKRTNTNRKGIDEDIRIKIILLDRIDQLINHCNISKGKIKNKSEIIKRLKEISELI